MATATLNECPNKPDWFQKNPDFWAEYEPLAVTMDRDSRRGLEESIDTLLIFAGLFSAVNTTFINISLANLSAPPSYQTNVLLTLLVMNASNNTLTSNDLNPLFSPATSAIRQNCTFLASLCSSILAAVGAVLAKQWLQSYDRMGRTKSREKQAMLWKTEWIGKEEWNLQLVVDTLPTLLLISLALFFVALCDLLWSTNQPVAIVVTLCTIVGTVFYGSTVTAAVSISSPEIAEQLRTIYQKSLARIRMALGLRCSNSSLSWRWSRLPIWNGRDSGCTTEGVGEGGARDDVLYARISECWMLESPTKPDEIVACAENIPSLSSIPSIRSIVCDSPLVCRPGITLKAQGPIIFLSFAYRKPTNVYPVHYGGISVPKLNLSQIIRLESRKENRDIILRHLKSILDGHHAPDQWTHALPPAQGLALLAFLKVTKLSPSDPPGNALLGDAPPSFLYLGTEVRVITILDPSNGSALREDDLGLKKKCSLMAAKAQNIKYNNLMVEEYSRRYLRTSFTNIWPWRVTTPLLTRNMHRSLKSIVNAMAYFGNRLQDCRESMLHHLLSSACHEGAFPLDNHGKPLLPSHVLTSDAARITLVAHFAKETSSEFEPHGNYRRSRYQYRKQIKGRS